MYIKTGELFCILKKLTINAKKDINQASNIIELDKVRIKYISKKGLFTMYINILNKFPSKERSIVGSLINETKKQILQTINKRKLELEKENLYLRLLKEKIDVSLPGRRIENGGLHPISITIDRIESFFSKFGFSVLTGPEIEDSYHNFDALNIPINHPARTDHDTFWLNENSLLRTQTSGVQIRALKNQKPPIKIIAPGRVYRNDYDRTHTPMFHQLEGLVVDKNISFLDLKKIVFNFLNYFFEDNIQIRFRLSYFPFTEPSAEVDIMNKNNEWLEILGCGMVHPNLLIKVGINSEIYSGFAFGVGIERLTMLRYNIHDLRKFFENDLRFLKQFK